MSNDFWDYLELRRELHDLITSGHGDGDQADALRDRMDAPWERMSETERLAAREYSTRLNDKAASATNGAGRHSSIESSSKTA